MRTGEDTNSHEIEESRPLASAGTEKPRFYVWVGYGDDDSHIWSQAVQADSEDEAIAIMNDGLDELGMMCRAKFAQRERTGQSPKNP